MPPTAASSSYSHSDSTTAPPEGITAHNTSHRRAPTPPPKLPADRERYTHGTTSTRSGSAYDAKRWIRGVGWDLLMLACVGAVILGVHLGAPAPIHTFPVLNLDLSLVNPALWHPRVEQHVPTWASVLIAFFVPSVFFLGAFLWDGYRYPYRSRTSAGRKTDVEVGGGISRPRPLSEKGESEGTRGGSHGVKSNLSRWGWELWLVLEIGLLKSITLAALIQVILKKTIGGLRPHFFAVCRPDLARVREAVEQSLQSSAPTLPYFTPSQICSPSANPSHLKDALQTFPSGHTAAAWSGLGFLGLWVLWRVDPLNYRASRTKSVGSDVTGSNHSGGGVGDLGGEGGGRGYNDLRGVRYWKMILLFAPYVGAVLLSGYLVIDGFHHLIDVLFSTILGLFTAYVAFRGSVGRVRDRGPVRL